MDSPILLIIEDDQSIAQLLTQFLESVGYRAVPVHDSRSALAWLAAHTPALILLDLWIPEYGGLRLAREIRARPGPVAPLLVLTGEYLTPDAILALGAAGYLRKPFNLDEIVAEVERLAPIDYDGTEGPASI